MLVLGRKAGQAVMIGHGITVTVLAVREDGTVRLGIEAPRDVPVHREEIYRRIRQQEAEA